MASSRYEAMNKYVFLPDALMLILVILWVDSGFSLKMVNQLQIGLGRYFN